MNQQQRAVVQQALDAFAVLKMNDYSGYECSKHETDKINEAEAALRQLLEQTEPVQEPFCYYDGRNIVGKEFADHSDVFPLYTTPPAQPAAWVWLKDDELIAAYRRGRDSVPTPTNGWCFVDDHIPGLREVQREVLYTLREKNGGAA
jgi:hypothetical protein